MQLPGAGIGFTAGANAGACDALSPKKVRLTPRCTGAPNMFILMPAQVACAANAVISQPAA